MFVDQEGIGSNIASYTVSEISDSISGVMQSSFGFVRVRGEVSQLTKKDHIYFNLRDENSVIQAVCFKTSLISISYIPEVGDEVWCYGKISAYKGQSKYQIIVSDIRVSGQGALLALFQRRKENFLQEGLFQQDKKKDLPRFPRAIAVITSDQGAVLQDIIHRVEERYPCEILLFPVNVQGRDSAEQVAYAVMKINYLVQESQLYTNPDVIIIARGGGSVEDLWGFNEEIVVRAVFESDIAVVSAIGHETDYTLIDYVSDKRAPTPTAAAEMVTPNRADLLQNISDMSRIIDIKVNQIIESYTDKVNLFSQGFKYDNFLSLYQNQVDHFQNIIHSLYTRRLSSLESRVNHCEQVANRSFLSCRQVFYNIEILEAKIVQSVNNLWKKNEDIEEMELMIEKECDAMILNYENKLREIEERIFIHVSRVLSSFAEKVDYYAKVIDVYDYRRILKKGFAIIRGDNGAVIKSSDGLLTSKNLQIELLDGKFKIKLIDLFDHI